MKIALRKIYTVVMTVCILFFCADLFAQLQLFSTSSSKKGKNDDPTIINSDAMDIDMANDKVTLLGNVDVQDPEMNIKCRKMIIYLGKNQNKQQKTGDSARDEQAGKEVVKIECTGDVVITRVMGNAPSGQSKENQQAFAGKAVYQIKEETITLTEDPVLVNGPNRLMGERIILHTKTDRVLVFKGVARAKGKLLEK